MLYAMRQAGMRSSSPFMGALLEATRITRALEILSGPAYRRLTAAAFVDEAKRLAGADEARLDTIDAQLGEPPMERARAAVEAVASAVAGRGAHAEPLARPPLEASQLHRLFPADARAALAAGGISLGEAFAAGARSAARRWPEGFGAVADWAAHERTRRRLAEQQAACYARLAREWTAADVRLDDPGSADWRRAGLARVTVAITDGAVAIFPVETLGERLVSWALAHPGALRG